MIAQSLAIFRMVKKIFGKRRAEKKLESKKKALKKKSVIKKA